MSNQSNIIVGDFNSILTPHLDTSVGILVSNKAAGEIVLENMENLKFP